jgi:hypothetical protein
LDLACGEPTQLRRSVVGKKDVQIPKRQKLAAGVGSLNVDPFLVPAFHLTPVQRVIGKYVGFSHRCYLINSLSSRSVEDMVAEDLQVIALVQGVGHGARLRLGLRL